MREVATTVPPWRWEADPGAEAVRMLLEQEAESRGGLHPILGPHAPRTPARPTDPALLTRGTSRCPHPRSCTRVDGRHSIGAPTSASVVPDPSGLCPAPHASDSMVRSSWINRPSRIDPSSPVGFGARRDPCADTPEGMAPRGRILLHVQGVTSITDATLDLATTMMAVDINPSSSRRMPSGDAPSL